MPRDPEKAKARSRRHRNKLKAKRFGQESIGVDLRGKHGNHAKGPRHPAYRDGITHHVDGYVKVQVGRSHPLSDPNGYAYLHHLVWVSSGKGRPATEMLIHHKDEVKTNNRIDNLELKSRSEHAKHHDANRRRDDLGRFQTRTPAEAFYDEIHKNHITRD